jgi:SnoaL-like protein
MRQTMNATPPDSDLTEARPREMSMALSKLTLVCIASLFCGSAVAEQASTLTAQDRADIQALVARYQTALSTCASQDYASLFVPDGVFISDDFRGKRHREMYGPNGGKLVGRAKLIELVDTEDFCLDKSQKRASPSTTPTAVIVPTPGGAKGTIQLANSGRYEDEYVKTSEGWRFKVRRVVMPMRPAAGEK